LFWYLLFHLQRLAWEGFIINEVILDFNEFTILVSEEQVDVAFKVIQGFETKINNYEEKEFPLSKDGKLF
jgi:hypothetical protein